LDGLGLVLALWLGEGLLGFWLGPLVWELLDDGLELVNGDDSAARSPWGRRPSAIAPAATTITATSATTAANTTILEPGPFGIRSLKP